MKLEVVNREGKEVESIEADAAVFGIEPNQFVIHQALLAQLANRRTGSANTKTRGEVAGSTAKLHRQKGTGRARLGASRSPAIRHGGIVFGPKPRSFAQRLPKRMRRLAIRSVLSAKVAEGSLRVLDALTFEPPRTKDMAMVLEALGLDRSTLVVTESSDNGVKVSARNLQKVDVLPAPYLNVGDMLSHRDVLMTVGAVRQAERLWGGERALRRRAPLAGPEPAVERAPSAPKRTRRRPEAVAPIEASEAEKPVARRRRKAAPAASTEETQPKKPATQRRRKTTAEASTGEPEATNA